ncbi:hypothetical protein SMD11_7016 [Streptomyces albireticuli]|uniref:Resolvase/invertase-type recombinase catalytic domain-containing protein n=1 Tax=Streptomyces albireticuli TaxID=1940 RepID=A0A1Z2LE83_9ACTN|nr:hypothetical protein [Streptomyces albireticuli]ARZ72592.1 hypothetical protein SMD11_7016 [Streptomyces albireticuli]
MEPLTEHRSVSGPAVYGFLRLVNVPTVREKALEESLAEYCRQHELTLSGLFTERVAEANSAAFTGLIDALGVPGTYGIVLPSASHLGPKAIAAVRSKRIAATGARMLLVRRGTPSQQREIGSVPALGTES